MRKYDWGEYCNIYGRTMHNLVLEYALENQTLDFAISDMIEQTGISKPKAYEIINGFIKKEYIKKTRVIGKTQLFMLNNSNRIVKLFLRNFKECMLMVLNDYSEKKGFSGQSAGKAKQHA